MSSCIENGDATMTTTTATKKTLLLRSRDGETFEVEEAVALQSQTIKLVFGDDCANKEIPVHNVSSSILSKVIEYCNKHVDSGDDDDITAWDADFVKVDPTTLFDLVLAANYLHIKGLLDLTCQAVADMIKGKTPAEIHRYFNIKNQFTPEQEEEVRRENQWAFE